MKLLTIGVGRRGAEISSLLHRKGAKVNRIPLFRCYAILSSVDDVAEIKLKERNKFYIPKRLDVVGVINEILSRYEIHEGAVIITHMNRYDVETALEVCRKLRDVFEDPIMILGVVGSIEDSGEFRCFVRSLKDVSNVLILTREDKINETVNAFNVIARVGEIDLRKKVAGEVVVDTSDFFNAVLSEGFTVVGYAKRNIPFFRFFMKRSHLLAIRTQRMLDMVREAIENLSFEGDVNSAKSSLIVFAGNPNEITMDGLFSCIDFVEGLNSEMVIRYGDYPIPNARFISSVVLFSGLRRFRLD
ncbi:MAG: cell division protein [Archaeoglobales archaeon]|nr:MAG: cell division protein [Archaeoglobales archaeon]